MSVKVRTIYRCSECGADSPKWAGRCDACGEWNTLMEEAAPRTMAGRRVAQSSGTTPVPPVARLSQVPTTAGSRISCGFKELDVVLGGGIVPGSVVLIGGEPGIGKSTLLLQVAAALSERGVRTLYVSGEESALQVRMRAERLRGDSRDVHLLTETSLEPLLAAAAAMKPTIMVVDSIQTLVSEAFEGAPGNVGQVRECAGRLMRFAKESGCAVFLVGHVTKGGGIAGPRTLEHIVDTVLYFEGESALDHRILRATKNRFGSVDEIGIFRMTAAGLVPVENASALFIGEHDRESSGTAMTAVMEGTRPLIVEVQALAAKAGYGTPQRVANGLDPRRLALLLAVLEKRAGIPFSALDVFVNVVGGLRLTETSGDLAIAAALASSFYDRPLPPDAVFIGEVGLGGEVRAVGQLERRAAEAAQLGFQVAYVGERAATRSLAVRTHPVRRMRDLFQELFT